LFLTLGSLICLASPNVKLSSDFSGGNVQLTRSEAGQVYFTPDLRGDRPWFYWYFEAKADKPGRVQFHVGAEHNTPRLAVNGPAVSEDGGKSWRWLGLEATTIDPKTMKSAEDISFYYDFKPNQLTVRFAVTIPYTQEHLEIFLKRHEKNPLLQRSVLTKSKGGRDVVLLRIGHSEGNRKAVLLAARSHASETMASFALEGMMEEALSDSAISRELLSRYVFYIVPFIDTDGVAKGDQGKNRLPHDHNRDYGPNNIYPEITAIQKLAVDKNVAVALDIHCPLLAGDIHEAFYWAGPKTPQTDRNLKEYNFWIAQEIPQITSAPLILTKKPGQQTNKFSHYFGLQPGIELGMTLEVPYSQRNGLDQSMMIAYGKALVRALAYTHFVKSADLASANAGNHEAFDQFQKQFRSTYMRSPSDAEALAKPYLSADANPIYQAEARYGLGLLRLRQKNYDEAKKLAMDVISSPRAMERQKADALSLYVEVLASTPDTTAKEITEAIHQLESHPYLSNDQRYKAYQAATRFFIQNKLYQDALITARKQFSTAQQHMEGSCLLQMATIYDQLGQKDKALSTRREVVILLTPRIFPAKTQGGILYSMMAGDLFDALLQIPGTPKEEIRAVATVLRDYQTVAAALRKKATDWLEANP
jgi:tetratricopeptide (TPR) repeat protein